MKILKITSAALFVMLAIFVLALSPVAAAASEEKGSIVINLSDNATEKPLSGVSFRLYFVARADKKGSNIRYELASPYDTSGLDIIDPEDASVPVHLAYFARTHSQPYTEKASDENGVILFEALEPGLYLAEPVRSEDDDFTALPFLISVPQYDLQSGKWQYNISASPKISDGGKEDTTGGADTYISVIKKWETDSELPESITVVLLCDFQEYERAELNSDNGWHYRFDNLPGNHTWSVIEDNVPAGYTVSYENSSNTVTIINKSVSEGEGTTVPSDGGETTTAPEDGDKLAQTGQLNWPVPVCAIAGILIFSAGWAVLNFGKKETE